MDAGTLELVELDHLLDSEVGCEFEHGKEGCSVHVTHVVSSCERTALICETGAQLEKAYLARLWFLCTGCCRPISHCWKVSPV